MRIENLRRDGKEEVGERALIKTRITRDESREMATDTVATFTTKLTLFHSIRILLARSTRFARASLKMRTISPRSEQRPEGEPVQALFRPVSRQQADPNPEEQLGREHPNEYPVHPHRSANAPRRDNIHSQVRAAVQNYTEPRSQERSRGRQDQVKNGAGQDPGADGSACGE